MSALPVPNDPLEAAEWYVRHDRFLEAIKCYEGMLEPAVDALGGLVHNLVPLYLKARRPALALRAAEALTFFAPQSTEAWMALAGMRERVGDWEGALQAVHQVLALNPMHEGAHQSRLFLLSAHAPQKDVRRYHEDTMRIILPATPKQYDEAHNVPVSKNLHRQIRVGYVSGDFRKHVMDRVIGPLLQYHTVNQFELFCYDTVNRPDAITAHLRTNLVQWRDISKLDDSQAADLIREDAIDILVDLSGITFGQRLRVFQNRPAPIQVTWAGYLPTTGAKCFTYKLCDETAGQQSDYTEPLWKLPNSLAPHPLPGSPSVGDLPALRNGYVTFGCVNSYAKVTRGAIDAWIEILRALPTARLVLVVAGASEEETALAVTRRFGPVQERVMLTEWQTGNNFPAIFADLDIALNTHPYGGCMTSFDTLWQGTPIVCKAGDRAIGRYAAHYQRALGLDQFIAADWKGYVECAVRAASDIPTLRHIRFTMRERIQGCSIFNVPKWVQTVESAYLGMWKRYCGG